MTNTIFHGYSKKDTENPLLISTKIKMKNRGVRGERTFTNFGRDVVFSADLCYNGDNEKASPLGRGGGEADGEG